MKIKFIYSLIVGFFLRRFRTDVRTSLKSRKSIQYSLLYYIKTIDQKLGTQFDPSVFKTEVSNTEFVAQIHKGKTTAVIYQVNIYDPYDHYLAEPLSSFWIYTKANKVMAVIYDKQVLNTLIVEVFLT